MFTELLSVVPAFLTAYASVLSALILVGQENKSSAYWAALPAIAAIGAVFAPQDALKTAFFALFAFGSLMVALHLSKRNILLSFTALLLAVSFALSGRILNETFLSADWQKLLSGLCFLLIAGMLMLFNIRIFPENDILTKEQRKSARYRQIYLFPGLVLLIGWQIYFLLSLQALYECKLALVLFTGLLHLTVLLFLKQQVQGLRERIENIIDKQYQSELLNFMQVIRSQRHDFNFHTQTICSMIESGRYDECKAYAQSMLQTVNSTNDILPLYHPAASALLNTFREMALQKGLQMEIEIHDNLQFIATSVYETNTILGNLLQNAIDELELHPENESRTIHVLIVKRGRNDILKVSNQCHLSPDEMSRIFMPGFTTKKSHEGLGLANALRIAEKYDGTVYPEFEGSTVHFIAKIPIDSRNSHQ